MKKISLLGICMFALLMSVSAQTLEEVLASFEGASGGRDKLAAVKTIKMESEIKMTMMGQDLDVSVSSIKENGKLYRRDMGAILMMGKSWTLVTDTAAYALTPAMNFGGGGRQGGGGGGFGGGGGGGDRVVVNGFEGPRNSAAAISKATNDELKNQQFELDCAGAFGPLVNYAAKGNTAELIGKEKVNKQECFKVKLTLASGQFITYYISSKNFLVMQIDATGPMAGYLSGFGNMMKMMGNESRLKNMKVSIGYSNYKEFGGIQFPTKEVINMGPVDIVVENRDIKLNDDVDKVWYKAQ
jgi:hypothetical protein